MVHPLVPQVETLARPIADGLGMEVVHIVFHTNQHPPVLRVDIRPKQIELDTSLAHCEAMSVALEARLDEADLVEGNYVLEVSSPGVPDILTTERDFTVFKGFPVDVSMDPPHKGRTQWIGSLVGRDEDWVFITQKGRKIKLPRANVQQVVLRSSPDP